MKTIWIIILKILLCISICIICIALYFWTRKKYSEGFQTTSTMPSPITIASGLFNGIHSGSKFTSPCALNQNCQDIDTGGTTAGFTIPSSNVIAISLDITTFGNMSKYVYNLPVSICDGSGNSFSTPITGYLFSYNHPYLIIHSNYVNGAYVNWGDTNFIIGNTYTIKVNYCDIYDNTADPVCYKNYVEPIPSIMTSESPVEEATYDNYILYNVTTSNTIKATNIEQYDMASELGEYDIGAPVPWDYDNRQLDPQEVLWGSIHPTCSQSIFTASYNLKTKDSINNITFNEDSHTWSYPSPLFNRTWTGDEEKFLPGIQIAEFLVQTGSGMLVEKAYDVFSEHYMASSKWCANVTHGIKALEQSKIAEKIIFNHLVDSGIDTKSARATSRGIANALAMNLKDGYVKLSDIDIQQIDEVGNFNKYTKFDDLTKAINSKLGAIDSKIATSATGLVDASAARTAAAVPVPPKAAAAAVDSRILLNTASEELRIKGLEMKPLIGSLSRKLNKGLLAKIAKKLSGPMIVRFAKALGMLVEGDLLIFSAAFLIGSITGPLGIASAEVVATILTQFLNVYTLSCMTFVPAILEAYIPSDGVCPAGSFNIYDAIKRAPGLGEIGWLIISNIPVIGDGIGTFGPYLCTKPDGSTVLKRSALVPMYYYDSTLSIYAESHKESVDQTDARYTDRRQYVKHQGDYHPPIWVDFAEKTMLDKMAQFYYNMARMTATDNGDGTYTFQYITRFYGVITSSEFSCDVQCEITEVTYYSASGLEQMRTIVPVDPTYLNTYHDRRFYFYAVQVDMNPSSSDKKNVSARKMESYYKKKGISFLTAAQRVDALQNRAPGLDALMIDNMNRYIVTACTNMDGTGVTAAEVNGEGDYVGDALISLGDLTTPYHAPELQMNTPMQFEIQSAITEPVSVTGSTATFLYYNPLKKFIKAGTKSNGESSTSDSVYGFPIPNSNLITRSDGTRILSSFTTDPIATTTPYFIGNVISYTNGSPQSVGISNIVWTNGSYSSSSSYVIIVKNPSNIGIPPEDNAQCSAIRGRLYTPHRIEVNGTPIQVTPTPSYAIMNRSINAETWAASSDSKLGYGGNKPLKVWAENKIGNIRSQREINSQIIQGTILNTIAYRVMITRFRGQTLTFPIPTGAIFAQGILGTAFYGHASILDMLACSYSDATSALGTYIRNGLIETLDEGDYTENKYRYVNRGPTIFYAPGYKCETAINKTQVKFTQTDCVNRRAVRYAVNKYNKKYSTNYVTKLLSIETDISNNKCLYVFEAKDNTTSANIISYKYSLATSDTTPVYVPDNNDIVRHIINLSTGVSATLNSENFVLSLRSTQPDDINLTEIPTDIVLITDSLSLDKQKLANIRRPGSKDGESYYTCNSFKIYDRLKTQFNLKYGSSPNIQSIKNAYYPSTIGSVQGDGTIKCIYKAEITTNTSQSITTSLNTTDMYYITMVGIPARDKDNALYDLLTDNWYSAYIYEPIPATGQWIAIPPPLPPSATIYRSGCADSTMSTCSHPDIIANLINQFNIQYVDGKIIKVNKAYTPLISNSEKVCDYEVEMMRQIPGILNDTTRNTLIQKESIRIPIKSSSSDLCLWDLNMTGSNIPVPDTGESLTNSASVELLSTPYIWAPSFLSNVRNTINGAILNYKNINTTEILSNLTMDVKNQVQNIYDTVASEQRLYHTDSNCRVKCKDKDVLQAIIDRYYADNYPISQYGAQKREMVEIRRAGTYTSNICQVEFIEKIDTYKYFISTPIHITDPTDLDAQFNTSYYLRQYDFQVENSKDGCKFSFMNLAALSASNDFSSIDTNGNAIAIMSDYSALTSGENSLLDFNGKKINCSDRAIMSNVFNQYNNIISGARGELNRVKTITKAFNASANVCEYYAPKVEITVAGSFNTQRVEQDRIITATWEDYNSTSPPYRIDDFGTASIRTYVEYGNYVTRSAIDNQIITPPFLYELLLTSNFPYDSTRVVSVSYP